MEFKKHKKNKFSLFRDYYFFIEEHKIFSIDEQFYISKNYYLMYTFHFDEKTHENLNNFLIGNKLRTKTCFLSIIFYSPKNVYLDIKNLNQILHIKS